MKILERDKILRFQEFCKLETVKDENFSMEIKMYSYYLAGAWVGGVYALASELPSLDYHGLRGLEDLGNKIESYTVHAVCNVDSEKFKNWVENCKYFNDKKEENLAIKLWFSFLDEMGKPDNLEGNK